MAWPRHPVVWGPTTPFASFSLRTPSSRKPKPQRGPHEGLHRLAGRRTPERKELSGGQESVGEIPSGGEIDAIAIVIERDIISIIIIIIIISTIYTAITTAAPRHRCNNSVADACKGYNHNESFIETAPNTFCSSLGSTFLLIEDTTIHPLYLWVITPPTRSANQEAMMQMLQMMMEDREAERAERQANIAALQQIAQNNQGHGNHDHPGSKLKNFQNTNPPMFSKTEEPLDADDWLQTMENNLEVAGVRWHALATARTWLEDLRDDARCQGPLSGPGSFPALRVSQPLPVGGFWRVTLSGPARAWWTSARAMNAGQMMTWEDFKLKFSKYHVPQGLIKKMRDEFCELKQGRMSVVEYRDRFLTLSRYAPDETDTNEKRKERFLNGLHDEMQTVLVNILFADLEALVDSAIQMEGKLHQANENRKRRMMNQNGTHHTQKCRNNSSGGFTPRYNKPPAQSYRPNYPNNNGGPPKPGGNNNNSHHHNNNPNNNSNNGNNNNTNTGPRTGSNAIPVTPKDKSTVNCYECGVVGHYSNECPKKLAKIAANTAAPALQATSLRR
ncbi:hypothetical protein QYE76_042352 [Lolium multiflorum]|uniref:CCHC-type domain-containing protein n=1 Tax=Lolium multiflorum TaxID=4521 RepID=A0AAD8TF25_LOLMU|nr:hypothetical protein QYE76_042352 [Lolium multiflorum]